jgi:hypothetical protein
MKRLLTIASALGVLAACGSNAVPAEEQAAAPTQPGAMPTPAAPLPSGPPLGAAQPDRNPVPVPAARGWESVIFEDGLLLRFVLPNEGAALGIACAGRPRRLTVSIPGVTAIGSEDRVALALGAEPVTMVADLASKAEGVTAQAPVPENFTRLLESAASIGALYGTQESGPYPPPSDAQKTALAEACAP